MLKDADAAAKEYIEITKIFSPDVKNLFIRLDIGNAEVFQDMKKFRKQWKVSEHKM